MTVSKSAKTEYYIVKVIVISLIIMTLSIVLCGCKMTDSKTVVTLNTISNTSENYEIHCSREDNLKSHPVLSSGFIELLVYLIDVTQSQCLDSSRWTVMFLNPAAVRWVFSSSGV